MKLFFTFALLLLSFLPAQSQAPVTAAKASPDDAKPSEADIRREAFDKVWNTVNEKHYDPTFGGVDWKKVREIYAPKAAVAGSRDEFHAVLRRMLAELKLSHFGIYPRQTDGISAGTSATGNIGVEVTMIGGQPVVSRVDAGSTAAAAGIRPGFIIQKVDDKTSADLLKGLNASFAGRGLTPGMEDVYRERTFVGMLGGVSGTNAKVEMLDEKDQPKVFEVARKPFSGEMSLPLGNFPPQEIVFESRKLASGIGYIRFNIWVIPQAAKFRQAMRELADAKGLIIDLRGNPGGVGGLAPGLAGLLVNERASLGGMNFRDTEQKFIVYPQANPFLGKIAVLTDHGSASTSEVFAAGLQDNGRAKIVGTTTAGAVLPSVFDTLPTGVIFQYAISDYRSPKNVLVEGKGVTPDIEVKQTREDLLKGNDLPLQAAEKLILSN